MLTKAVQALCWSLPDDRGQCGHYAGPTDAPPRTARPRALSRGSAGRTALRGGLATSALTEVVRQEAEQLGLVSGVTGARAGGDFIRTAEHGSGEDRSGQEATGAPGMRDRELGAQAAPQQAPSTGSKGLHAAVRLHQHELPTGPRRLAVVWERTQHTPGHVCSIGSKGHMSVPPFCTWGN